MIKKILIKKAVNYALFKALKEINEIPDNALEFSIIVDFKFFTSILGTFFALHWNEIPETKKAAKKAIISKWVHKTPENAEDFIKFVEEISPDKYEIRLSFIRYTAKIDKNSIFDLYSKLKNFGY